MISFLFRLTRVLIVLFIAAGLAFWLYSIRQPPQKQKKGRTAPGVRVTEARSGPEIMVVESFGTVKPRNEVSIAGEVAGRIAYLHPLFREGGLVPKGDVLIRVDKRSFVLERTAAQIRVDRARIDIRHLRREIENLRADKELAQKNLVLSQKELARLTALSQNQFASGTSLDRAEQQVLAARIQVQTIQNRLSLTPAMMANRQAALSMALNDLDKAALILEKSEIRMPFNGYVLARQADLGEYINPGQTLGSLYDMAELDVDLHIPLDQVRWIRTGFGREGGPDVRVFLANVEGPNLPQWTGRVARIKARIDEKTRTLPMTVEIASHNLTNPLMNLKPGTFVRCELLGQAYQGIFRLPRHLLQSKDRVYLAVNSRLVIQNVDVLRKFRDAVYIRDGLASGDLVIVSPLPGPVAGMPLDVKPMDTKPLEVRP